jgi:hypothetical protein
VHEPGDVDVIARPVSRPREAALCSRHVLAIPTVLEIIRSDLR